jgi:hypothetical protein
VLREQRISSWAELHDALYAGSWRSDLGRHRTNLALRGHPDTRPPRSGLALIGGEAAQQERRLLRAFRKYASAAEVRWPDSAWNWLAVAQHHGLPTRLIDWTYSPYVALHFATADLHTYDRDGAIYCLDYVEASKHLPDRLRALLDEEDSNVFTVEMLNAVAHSLDELAGMADGPFVAFLEPPSFDERIVNQYALFSLMSDPAVELESWLEAHPDLCCRIVIPAELKWEVRDKLDQANVTERVLFPGLDGLSAWLRRYYMVPGTSLSGKVSDVSDPNWNSRSERTNGRPQRVRRPVRPTRR